ncbi:thermonuclease family protein, partial [Candidatus Riflebacteria bacterium]
PKKLAEEVQMPALIFKNARGPTAFLDKKLIYQQRRIEETKQPEILKNVAQLLPEPFYCRVLKVTEGDTIIVNYLGEKEEVRLLNVDTPENSHPNPAMNTELGEIAAAYARIRLEGKVVRLEFEGALRDGYGRLLAYLFVDEENFNRELIWQGLSPYSRKNGISKKYHKVFLDNENIARQQKKNIWVDRAKDEKPDIYSSSRKSVNQKIFPAKMMETIEFANWLFLVSTTYWKENLLPETLVGGANPMFLILPLTVRNASKKPQTLLSMVLVNYEGIELIRDRVAESMVKNSFSTTEEFSKNQTKMGFIVFRVREKGKFFLKIKSGTGQNRFIQLF